MKPHEAIATFCNNNVTLTLNSPIKAFTLRGTVLDAEVVKQYKTSLRACLQFAEILNTAAEYFNHKFTRDRDLFVASNFGSKIDLLQRYATKIELDARSHARNSAR